MKNLFVVSLGGSLIVPDGLDVKFLKAFRALILERVKKGDRFILMTGGGRPAREYQSALKAVGSPTGVDLDWIGIQATWLNAKFVQLMFGKLGHLRLVSDPNVRVKSSAKILVAGGWLPGRSTDDDAVRLAKTYHAHTIINLSNVDYLYTKDPRKDKMAKKIERISWQDYTKMVGKKWSPGANYPFDPVAALTARKNKQTVVVADGQNLKNLQSIFAGKNFKGTVIS